jgi:hypothetical protein
VGERVDRVLQQLGEDLHARHLQADAGEAGPEQEKVELAVAGPSFRNGGLGGGTEIETTGPDHGKAGREDAARGQH